MQDNNESRVDVIRQALEKHLQGVDATGGRPDANCRKAGRLVARSSPVFGGPFLFFRRMDPVIVIAHVWSARLFGRKGVVRSRDNSNCRLKSRSPSRTRRKLIRMRDRWSVAARKVALRNLRSSLPRSKRQVFFLMHNVIKSTSATSAQFAGAARLMDQRPPQRKCSGLWRRKVWTAKVWPPATHGCGKMPLNWRRRRASGGFLRANTPRD